MKHHLASYRPERGDRAGLVVAERILDLADFSGRDDFASALAVLARWDENKAVLASLAERHYESRGMPLASVCLLTPILYPGAIFCAGANFLDHCSNMARAHNVPVPENPKAKGAHPFHFLKASRCCVGTGEAVAAPSPALDYEVELAVVIGREGRNIPVEEALDHVAGYMVANDLSARDIGFRRQLPREDVFHHSWLAHKSFEHSAPIGPWLTPKEYLPDWRELRFRTRVNGEIRRRRRGRRCRKRSDSHSHGGEVSHPGTIRRRGQRQRGRARPGRPT